MQTLTSREETGIISGETVLLRTLEEVGGGATDKHSIRRLNKPSKVAPRDEDNKAMTVCHGHHEGTAGVCEDCTCL